MGYCGVDSAELCRVGTGDLGTDYPPALLPPDRHAGASYAPGHVERIGLASAATRVNVKGLD